MRGTFGFAWRALRRDWHAGELRILAMALVVAVAAISAVGFFTDRVRAAMEHQAGELLAADRVVESSRPLDPALEEKARALGLRTARTLFFRSVVAAGEELQLVEVKAVDQHYPLRGALRVAQGPFAPDLPAGGPPPRGTLWPEARLFTLLDLAPGSWLSLGETRLEATGVLAYEPDRGGMIFSIAPRLMMNLGDVEATGLIQSGSLATYRLLLAGEPAALAEFEAWVKPRLEPGLRWLGGRDAGPELGSALTRGERFLGLSALVAVLLSGVAVATAAHRHARRHLDSSAMLRCLGASRRFVALTYVQQLALLGLAASVVGAGLGFAAQEALARALATFFAQALPAPSWLPGVQGVATGMVTLAGFALPPVLWLGKVPPLRVLRRDLGPSRPSHWMVYGFAGAVVVLLIGWQARDLTLGAYALAGSAATVAALGGIAALLVRLLKLSRRQGGAWRFGLANIHRRAGASIVQVVALGLGIMALLLLSLVRADLLEGWRRALPEDAPNHFLVNVQGDQVAPMREFLGTQLRTAPQFHPMVRGRLVALNGQPVSADDYEEPRAQRLVQREFNLSRAERPLPDNRIVAGRWWSDAGDPHQWSVEKGLAETLGIAVGDTLRFRVGGRDVEGRVTSLRTVEWDSFQVNFFVIAPPELLREEEASYITSFYLPSRDKPLLSELVRTYPNVTVIDVDALMGRVRTIIDRVVAAVEFVFVFTLLAGLVVLLAAIQTTHDERLRESAVLRTLGASHRQVRAALAVEFVALGLLAGTVAALAASAVGFVLATRVFDVAYQLNHGLWVTGLLAGALGVGLAGMWGTRRVLRHPPLKTLREL